MNIQRHMSESYVYGNIPGDPLDIFVETITSCGTGSLNHPGSAFKGVKSEFFGYFTSCHGLWEILFVGKDKENCIGELFLCEHPMELITSLFNSFSIVAVNDEDETLSVLVVVPPKGSDLDLGAHVPHCE